MASTKLTSPQTALRSDLSKRYVQRTNTSGVLSEFGSSRSQRKSTSGKRPGPLVLFSGKVQVVTPEEKKCFYAAARDPKNKDRKDFPIVELF